MSIERTNRLRIALQKAKAGLSDEQKAKPHNPSKLGQLLNKPSSLSKERRFIQSQPIHERPLMGAITKEILGDDVTYRSTINLNANILHD